MYHSCGFKALVSFDQIMWLKQQSKRGMVVNGLLGQVLFALLMPRADAAEAYVEVKVLVVAALLLKRGW
jgi:hypothetical protein